VSREVDPNKKNLSDDDKMYLAQRGLLSTDVMSVEDQRKMLDPDKAGPSALELANTGTVATMTTDELEAELERRRAAVDDDPSKLFTNPGGLAGAAADEDRISGDYDDHTKGELSAEIDARNTEREDEDDYEPMALSGSKAQLVTRLQDDDADRAADSDDEDDDSEEE
jgi:hypothetical protein